MKEMVRELLIMLAVGIIGISLIIAGVFVIAGFGWSLIAAGVAALCVAGVIHRGVFRVV